MIFQGSRYASSCIESVPDSSGVYHATVYPGCHTATQYRYTTYRVQYGDRLDTIATTALGDPELWWRVADVNPEILYPDSLTPGMVIRVPSGVA